MARALALSRQWREDALVTKRKAVSGDVCQFALGDGRYGYGRVLRDASIAIYRSTSASPATPPIGEREFIFTVGVYDEVPGSVACPVVGHDASRDPTEDWPPPYCVTDKISGRKSIYHRGELTPADEDSCIGMEPAAVWDLRHILERIVASLAE
jgi:hypothetical protein